MWACAFSSCIWNVHLFCNEGASFNIVADMRRLSQIYYVTPWVFISSFFGRDWLCSLKAQYMFKHYWLFAIDWKVVPFQTPSMHGCSIIIAGLPDPVGWQAMAVQRPSSMCLTNAAAVSSSPAHRGFLSSECGKVWQEPATGRGFPPGRCMSGFPPH